MLNKFKTRWEELGPNQKRKVVVMGIVSCFLAVTLGGYFLTHSSKLTEAGKKQVKKEMKFDDDLLKKTQYEENKKAVAETNESVERMRKEIEALKAEKAHTEEAKPVPPPSEKGKPGAPGRPSPQLPKIPPPPPGAPAEGVCKPGDASGACGVKGQPGFAVPPPPGATAGNEKERQKTAPTIIGSIGAVSQEPKKDNDEDKKKEKNSVYLPPSFMEATLLSGLAAPTQEQGKGSPLPALLRVKAPAVLPNEVRANLKGCFVIAEGYGNLADERVHLRLTNISCLAKDGQAVIDHKIKGFVVDSDGSIGLKGTVVTKMGSMIARSLVAGLFQGLGNVMRAQAMTASTSPLGTTTTIETDQIPKAAVGMGVGTAAREVQQFYLNLAHQTFPVVEVGATKVVTLVVSEGAQMEIKEVCTGGGKCE